jgi:hypothetical protein
MKYLIAIACAALLTGCVTTSQQSSVPPGIFSALDSQSDGYSAALGGGASFQIVSTRTDGTRLCRVVNIDQPSRFTTESFCKIKGGAWR